jgi:hypothetical protein
MKKSVYITGISCAILMLFGCIFKIMHWPGASPMIVLAVGLFCFWFLPSALMNSYESLPLKKMKTLHIVSFLVFSVCMMGVLFKIMHWPGASVFLLLGLLLPFVIFLPVYLYHTREEEKTGNKNFFGLIIGLTFLAVFGVLLALSVSKQVIQSAVMSVTQNETTTKFHAGEPKDSEVSKVATDLLNYTDELKCMMLSATDANMCDGNKTNASYKADEISGVDNREVVKRVFFSKEEESKAKILKEKVNAFRETVLSTKNISPELAELAKTLFDTGENDVNGVYQSGISWEQREFNNYSLIFTLDFLSKLQNNVRLVEGEVLN